MEKIERLKPKSISDGRANNGGARRGAGHPKGKKTDRVVTREAALRAFRDKVAAVADQLFITQFNMARGEQFLFHVKTVGKGAKARRETVVVTDVELIKLYLMEELDNTDEDYYFISTKAANNQALDSLLNRTFGTAQQSIDLTSDSKPLPAPIYGGLSVAERDERSSR